MGCPARAGAPPCGVPSRIPILCARCCATLLAAFLVSRRWSRGCGWWVRSAHIGACSMPGTGGPSCRRVEPAARPTSSQQAAPPPRAEPEGRRGGRLRARGRRSSIEHIRWGNSFNLIYYAMQPLARCDEWNDSPLEHERSTNLNSYVRSCSAVQTTITRTTRILNDELDRGRFNSERYASAALGVQRPRTASSVL